MDRKTRAVIRAFQAKSGLPITGEISTDLEIAIRARMQAIASIGRTPFDPVKMRLVGSGTIVSAAGHILTNAHVVDRCGTNPTAIYSLVVPIDFSESIDSLNDRKRRSGAAFPGRPLTLIAIDARNDLAVLSSSAPAASIAIFRDKPSPRIGESVVVAGFALPGVPTSDLNVSTGTIGPVIGQGTDRHMFQITAPIQPANNGGPVFDLSGNVVGVVVSRLDALKLAQRTKQFPQNVNFAIDSAIARAFLDAHKIAYKIALSMVVLSPVNIAARAREITVLVGCAK
jgi:hypothetical protein